MLLLAGAVLAQFQGYNNPVYVHPDAATGGPGWRSGVSNAVWTLRDATSGRATLAVTTNGTVSTAVPGGDLGSAQTPWRTNFLSGGLQLGAAATVTFADGTRQSTAASVAYRMTPSGLSVALAPSVLVWADGSVSPIAAQSIALWPSATNYIGIDLFDLSLHNYPRALDMGTKWLAQVVTDPNGVVSQVPLASDAEAPAHRFEGIKQKLLDGGQPVSVSILGDSISGPYPGFTTNWVDIVFNQPAWYPAAYLPHTAVWAVTNYAIGTQAPPMGMCMIGNAVVAPSLPTSGNLGYASSVYGDGLGAVAISPVIESQPDLVIIGYYNNPQNYKLPYIERMVQRARARGCAVILHATLANQGVGATDRQSEGTTLRTIADQHGAMFLDSWARAYEARNLKGVVFSPGTDQLHANDAGQLLWAAWIRSILPPNRQKAQCIEASPILASLPASSSPAAQLALPYNMETEFQFSSTGGFPTNIFYNNIIYFNQANPAIVVGGRPAATGAVALPVGTSAYFSHPHALTFSLLVDGAANAPSGFSYSLSVGPTTILNGSFANLGPRPAIVEILSVEQMRALSASLYNFGKADFFDNVSLAVNITSGTAVVYGGVWGVPAKRDVPLSALSYSGSGWDLTDKPGDASGTVIRGTDATNDSVRFTFQGAGAQLLLQGGPSAGKVRVYVDGAAVTTLNGQATNPYYDQFITVNRFIPINVFPLTSPGGNANPFSTASHTLRVVFDGTVHPSSGTPTSTRRRLAVCGATVFGPGDLIR